MLLSIAAVFFGSALLAGSVYLLVHRTRTTGNFGTVEHSPSDSASTTSNPTPKSTGSAHTSIPPTNVAGPPAALDLPTIHIHARVENVVTTHGILGVPDDPSKVGWWTGSALAGSTTGSTVLDGHVDSAVTGTGALFAMTKLAEGDRLSITTTAGHVVNYRVTGRRVYTKHEPLPPELFTTTGPPRLVLITCGGPFDTTTRSYEDNIVVFAAPDP